MSVRQGRSIGRAVAAFVVGTWLVLLVTWVLAGLLPRPVLINPLVFSQASYARDGTLLRIRLTSDERFRLHLRHEEIPARFRQLVLLQEDRYFYYHPGVNPFALARATWGTFVVRNRRIGGSTITMQLARLRFGITSRTVTGKIRQILYALYLERFYSKDELLDAYINLAPYGRNIEGLGAASRRYFGKSPAQLREDEMIALAVIPQHPAARQIRAQRVTDALEEARARLAPTVGTVTRPLTPLLITDRLPFEAPHLSDRLRVTHPTEGALDTTLSLPHQRLIERHLTRWVENRRSVGIRNGAAILVDYRTMAVRAYVGSANFFDSSISGQVDGIRAKRSPGSALKPFIYALSMDDGLIHPHSLLKDAHLTIANYNPENFDRDFIGPIDATQALVQSRNIPAIELTQRLGVGRFYYFLKAAGVSRLRPEEIYGLSLALGGIEVSMEEIATLYSMLANGGELRPLRFLENLTSATSSVRLLSREASALTLDMLRQNPRPHQERESARHVDADPIPWKTGTSYGFRDAWAVGVIGPYVLAVWVGNFDGAPNPAFIGRDAAGPLFFAIADGLASEEQLVESPPRALLNITTVKVCALSGELPGEHCPHTRDSPFIPGISPIRRCTMHRPVTVDLVTGEQACPGTPHPTTTRVFEFWPSDLLALFRRAGIARALPPAPASNCDQFRAGTGIPEHGSAPVIDSPQEMLIYSITADKVTKLPFHAIADSDVRTIFWLVENEFVGSTAPSEPLLWEARTGRFSVRAVDDRGRTSSKTLTVELVR